MSRVPLALVTVMALAACEQKVPLPAAMDPVSEQEAAALAVAFERAMEPVCDGAKLQPLLDPETNFRRAIHGAKLSKRDAAAVYRGLLVNAARLGARLCGLGGLLAETRFDLVRIRERAGHRTVVMRTDRDDRTSYLELVLGKSKGDHRIRILDIFVFDSGEHISETQAALATTGMEAVRAGFDPLTVVKIGEARERGDAAEARRLLATLPAPVRNSKQGLLLQLQDVTLDSPEHQALMERFERAFPDDPALDGLGIDLAFARKDVGGMLRTVDRLDLRVGGDPFLALFRSNGYMLDPTPENLRLARQAVRGALAALPHNEDLWWNLLSVQVLGGDHAGALATLTKLEDDFDSSLDEDIMKEQANWQVFLASPEYKAWAAR